MQPLDHPHMMTVPSTIKLDERFEDDVPLCVVAGFRFDIRVFRTDNFSISSQPPAAFCIFVIFIFAHLI